MTPDLRTLLRATSSSGSTRSTTTGATPVCRSCSRSRSSPDDTAPDTVNPTRARLPGREGGPPRWRGTPPVAEFAPSVLAARLELSAYAEAGSSPTCRPRTPPPRPRARVQTWEIDQQHARFVARKTRDLTPGATEVDARIAKYAEGGSPGPGSRPSSRPRSTQPTRYRRRPESPRRGTRSRRPPDPPSTGCAGSTSARTSPPSPASSHRGLPRPSPAHDGR